MDAARARSLLAWLAGFEPSVASALSEFEEEDVDDQAAVDALWPLLADGALLRRTALTGEEPLLPLPPEQDEDDEEEEEESSESSRHWAALVAALGSRLPPSAAEALLASSPSPPPPPPLALQQAVQALLGAAIAPEAPRRAESIRRILSLTPEEQACLKLAIEEQMSLASSASASSSNDGDDATPVKPSVGEEGEEEDDDGVVFWGGGRMGLEEEEDMTIQVPPLQSTLLLGDGGGKEEEEGEEGGHKRRLLEARVAELEGENRRLQGAAEAAAAREEQVRQEAEELRHSLLSQALSGEVQSLEREQQQREQAADVAKRLAAAERRLAALGDAEATIAALQDEVDVLRPAAQRLEGAEQALGKVKARLQALQDVKEQLVAEQAAHQEALDTALKHERELQQLPALKRQLEALKHHATETELEMRELRAAGEEKAAALERARAEAGRLREALTVARSRSEGLESELLEAAGGEEGEVLLDGAGGLGVGLSECNPDVIRRMRALEEEAATLRAQLSATAQARVEELEGELDAQRRLAQGFEGKYRTTRGELATATHELEQSKALAASLEGRLAVQQATHLGDVRRLREESDRLRERLAEARATADMAQEEIEMRVHHLGREAAWRHARTEAAARFGALVYKAHIASLTAEVSTLRSTLETEVKTKAAAEACVMILREKGEEARVAGEAAVGAAREEGERRLRELYAQAQAHIREKEEGFRREVAAVEAKMAEYERGHAVTNEEHHRETTRLQRALEVARQEAAAVGDELEQARMIHTRLEKEKKFLSDEAQRLRKELLLLGDGKGNASSAAAAAAMAASSLSSAAGRAAELEARFEELKNEYSALLKDYQRQQAGIRLAEHDIGFSLADFSPLVADATESEPEEAEGEGEEGDAWVNREEEEEAAAVGLRVARAAGRRMSMAAATGGRHRGGTGLQRDFETAATATLTPLGGGGEEEGRGGARRVATTAAAAAAMGAGARGPNHSLYTPPERVPVLNDAGASHYQGEIARLVHKNRALVLEKTAAQASLHKLETELATVKSELAAKEDKIGSLEYQIARLGRQVDLLSSSSASSGSAGTSTLDGKAAAAASVGGVAGKENTAAGRGGGIGTSYM